MNKDHLDIDNLTRGLLKKSLQKPASSDFDEVLMQKIIQAPMPVKQKSNGISTKKAWIFWIFTVVFFIVSLLLFTWILSGYLSEVNDGYKLTINYIFYGGLALFVPLVLYYFDALVQLMFVKKIHNVSIT